MTYYVQRDGVPLSGTSAAKVLNTVDSQTMALTLGYFVQLQAERKHGVEVPTAGKNEQAGSGQKRLEFSINQSKVAAAVTAATANTVAAVATANTVAAKTATPNTVAADTATANTVAATATANSTAARSDRCGRQKLDQCEDEAGQLAVFHPV